MRRKLENPWFEILYFIVAPSGGAEKKLNMGAQLHTIHDLFKTPKTFLKISRLNSVSVMTNGDTDMRFFALPVRT